LRILFIAPLPPPITGHSLAAQVLLDSLRADHDVEVVNLSVGSSNDGSVSIRRIVEVAKVLSAVARKRRDIDVIYLTIAESFAGNIKDLLIYLVCYRDLPNLYIHLHGGSIKRLLFDRHSLVRRINARAVKRMAGVIICGASHAAIFRGMIAAERIHIVPNFAEDDLFVSDATIAQKFANLDQLRILYLSGMSEGKGYLDLLAAYLLLDDRAKQQVRVDFAGSFDTYAEEEQFRERIRGIAGIRYHGLVRGPEKRTLFASAHGFCLPTTLFEGQPISILEAYAGGCVVITTGQAGILDIFSDGINGFRIDAGSPTSIAACLNGMLVARPSLETIAAANRDIAGKQYRVDRFRTAMTGILSGDPGEGELK